MRRGDATHDRRAVGLLFDEVATILRGPAEDVGPGLDAFEARHAVTNPLELGFLENDPTRRPDENVGLGEAMREQSFVSWVRRVAAGSGAGASLRDAPGRRRARLPRS